jgi:hypothetical protein
VSTPEDRQEPSSQAEPRASQGSAIFHAYQGKESRSGGARRYLLALAVLLALGTLGQRFVAFRNENSFIRVDTPWGMRTVRKGMSPAEVEPVMGSPVTRELRGDVECLQYGRPTINHPRFVLYTVCYEDGELRDISERRYDAWVVTPDGAIAPAPLEAPPTSLAQESVAP